MTLAVLYQLQGFQVFLFCFVLEERGKVEWVFVVTRNTGNNVCLSVPWDWVFPWRLLRNIHRGQSRGLGMGYASPTGEGNGNPLQYSCPEKPVDRGAWRAAVQRVAQSRTRLSMHACIGEGNGNHSSILAWRIPETEKPGGLPSMGSHRVGQD